MLRNLSIIVLCLSFLGCAHPAPVIVNPNAQPVYGMSKKDMLDVMGKPDYVEIYKKSNSVIMEFDIYIRQYGTTSFKLPVGLINNKVVGWGPTYYSDHMDPDDVRIK